MKLNLLISFSTLLAVKSIASAQLQGANTRDLAMGNASVGIASSKGIAENFASMVESNATLISCNVTTNYFIKDLSPVFASIFKSFNNNTAFEGNIGRLGNHAFSEQFVEGGIAKKIGKNLSAAVKLQYHQWIITDSYYSNNHTFIPTIFLFTKPLKNISFGALIRNPVRSRMNAIENNRLPTQIKTGASLKVSDKLTLACSVNQQTNQASSCQAGVEYSYHQSFIIRFGWHTLPVSESIGFSLLLPKINIECSIQTHPALGNSSSISLTFVL